MTNDLTKKHCVPCEGGTKPMTKEQIAQYVLLVPEWNVYANDKLVREVKKKNFQEIINLVNSIAKIAEEEQHHPDLFIHGWNKLTITLSTHAIGGLSENDFILAAKTNALLAKS